MRDKLITELILGQLYENVYTVYVGHFGAFSMSVSKSVKINCTFLKL